ncbi:MAG: sigma-70 family RNA polymerase sigma factor [Microthrixaceae bacterium]
MTDAGPTDGIDIDHAVEDHRRELTGFCYRMLGAGSEAEDAVQETMVRAWRAADGFEGRSSVRTWLFRIAHNVCVDMVRSPQRRALPVEMGPSQHAADVVLGEPMAPGTWVEPVSDNRVLTVTVDPAELATERDSVRLAFVAALQHLPARQRSALILCDVLRWPATEAASALDTTVASINSGLQRARATLSDRRGAPLDDVADATSQMLLERYVDAFQRYDMDALVALMRDDIVLSMPPFDVWLQGPDELVAWFTGQGAGCNGSRLIPVELSGGAGFASYKPAGPGVWAPFALQVIEVRGGLLAGHHNYLYPDRFAEFGLPTELTADDG